MNAPASIYLASQSPRRAQLLAQIGVAYELLLAGSDEDAESLEALQPGEPAADYVQRVTFLKSAAAAERWGRRALPEAPILCADTTVAIDDEILGKPADAAAAVDMLTLLSGRSHRVLTAVTLGLPGRAPAMALNVSTVRFAPLTAQQIGRYVAAGEPFGKAGGYAVQGAAAAWIEHIEGSFSGIMGLPLHETARLLRDVGVDV